LPNQRVRLSDGTFFGEIALLHRTKRSADTAAVQRGDIAAGEIAQAAQDGEPADE